MLHGSERGDTSPVCGDTDNGFLAIFNWALLGDGEHTAVAYDNGVEFARSTFEVGTLGEEVVRGAEAEVRVENFPSPGESTRLVWNESSQHFEVVPESLGPDLIVQSPSVSDNNPDVGESFTLRATVHNQGDEEAASTTLRYYRSSDSTISSSDTQVGTDTVSSLNASGTSPESISVTAPTSAGTYYYGACVNSVSGEDNTSNNCSSGVRVTVQSSGGGSGSDDHSDTPSGATFLPLGSSRSGRIETDDDTDIFRVEITETGTLTVYTTGSRDTEGGILNSAGSLLAYDDDSGSGYNFRISHSVRPGTYYIGVESWEDTDSYTLHADFVRSGGGSGSGGGACRAGLVVNPGESCTYLGHTFSVSASGRGSIAFFSAGNSIDARGSTINGVRWNFYASKNSGSNSWTIHTAE